MAVNGSQPIVVSNVKLALGIGLTLTKFIEESEHPELFIANNLTSNIPSALKVKNGSD